MGTDQVEGASEDTEYVASQRMVSKGKDGIESTLTRTFQPEGGRTQVTVEAEYTVLIPVLGKVAEAFIVRVNEHEAETLLANLEGRMEV